MFALKLYIRKYYNTRPNISKFRELINQTNKERFLKLYCSHAYDLARDDDVIISDDYVSGQNGPSKIQVSPTRSILSFCVERQQYFGWGYVRNLTDQELIENKGLTLGVLE